MVSMSFLKTLVPTIYYYIYTSEHKQSKSIKLSEIWRTVHNYGGPNWLFSSSSKKSEEHSLTSSTSGDYYTFILRFPSSGSNNRAKSLLQGKLASVFFLQQVQQYSIGIDVQK